ncbi:MULTISPECIES: hypothetical protein [unclassified Sedimentibacter]|uniref:hypothetical protein n=1 Tax=unclassified Sedimentibacter TaxID=2649220 RepID=UPI0027E0F6FB|nr:hypothetical protein [Sedimentibacter sp. MB35-C1]WMJ78510.1 hypothetical protein RBQ61_06195 [Sedimentibacter sp. MB35-C1]
MKQTTNYNLVKPELTDSPPDITVMNPNWDKIDERLKEIEEENDNLDAYKADLVDGKVPKEQLPEMNYLSSTGDGKDVTVTFTESGSRININTTEKLSVLFGKIKKYFTDLKTVAFTGSYTDLSNKPTSLPADGGTSAACSGNSATATKLQIARQINGVAFDGTANITIADDTKAPKSHASTGTTYGVGTTSNYGHVKTINSLTQSSHANGTALSAYQGKVLKDLVDAKPDVVTGVYAGDGTSSRNITLGFQPKAVFLSRFGSVMGENRAGNLLGGLALSSYPTTLQDRDALTITSTGYTVVNNINYDILLNSSGNTYYYTAIK